MHLADPSLLERLEVADGDFEWVGRKLSVMEERHPWSHYTRQYSRGQPVIRSATSRRHSTAGSHNFSFL
jgi:hypothetical protein